MRCPGQDTRYWKPGDIFLEKCPHCGASIEFWKDEIAVTCRNCGKRVYNPRFDPGCAAWCAYAEQCLGEMAKLYSQHPQLVRERLEAEARATLPHRQEAIARGVAASKIAETLLPQEPQANAGVVIAACLLQDLDDSPDFAVARRIMEKAGLPPAFVNEVLDIVAHRHRGGLDTVNYRLFAAANRRQVKEEA